MDEKDYSTGMGDTGSLEGHRPAHVAEHLEVDEVTLSVETLMLWAHGNTLIVTNQGTKPNGEPIDDSIMFQRRYGRIRLGRETGRYAREPRPPR